MIFGKNHCVEEMKIKYWSSSEICCQKLLKVSWKEGGLFQEADMNMHCRLVLGVPLKDVFENSKEDHFDGQGQHKVSGLEMVILSGIPSLVPFIHQRLSES